MKETDKRNKLAESPFTYKLTKAEKVILFHNNKQVMVLNEKNGKKFINRIRNKTDFEVQLIVAKLTGNFKRGNEKAKDPPDGR